MKLFFSALLLLFSSYVNGQSVGKQYIDEWLIKCDTAYEASKISGYVFNNIFYDSKDSVKLNNELKLLANNNLLSIDPFWNEELLWTTENTGKPLVFIVTRGKQSINGKRAVLKTAITKYPKPPFYQSHISTTSTEPVLIIDGKYVFHADCYDILSRLKANSIADIYYNKHPVPTEYYGQNAKNGLVVIWTK